MRDCRKAIWPAVNTSELGGSVAGAGIENRDAADNIVAILGGAQPKIPSD